MFVKPKLSLRALVAYGHDLTIAALGFAVALTLRVGWDEALRLLTNELRSDWALFTLVCAVVFLFTGLYQGIWRYASLNDLIAIMKAVTLALTVYLVVSFVTSRVEDVPRTLLPIGWMVLVLMLGGSRMLYQIYKNKNLRHLLEKDSHLRVPVLLVGAGDAAEIFIRAMQRDPSAPYEVLGALDDHGRRVGRRIHSVPVLGLVEEADQILARFKRGGRPPQRLVLTKTLERDRLTKLFAVAEARGLSLARLPRLTDLGGSGLEGGANGLTPRPIAIEDLLRRPEIVLDESLPKALVAGKRVLVTGAGGSIGSELVRQLAGHGPAEITLTDNSEYNLYTIDRELAEKHPDLPRRARLIDVRSPTALEEIFAATRPEVVFHAAAYKHVPLVEENPNDGLTTNVLGTRHVADACCRHAVGLMVMISSDKAVNPTNIMGASKRLAERYCQALDLEGRHKAATRIVTVRFGNVLGSTGSVVPLFQRQLAAGGPLTVTHPDMTRYFMTIREAVRLVLQAAALDADWGGSAAGRIYVLDMGEPVKILELAEQMIRLAGKRPYKDVEIKFTGLRPGEKLYEELFHDAEPTEKTNQPGLLLASPRTNDLAELQRDLNRLSTTLEQRQAAESLALLKLLVSEFRHEENRPAQPGPQHPTPDQLTATRPAHSKPRDEKDAAQ